MIAYFSVWKTIKEGYLSYGSYLWHEITHPSWNNYFYWLIVVSLFFFCLELVKPWRRDQKLFRKDFWLDFFYMFFNFFLFSLIIYNAASDVVVNLFNSWIESLAGYDLQASNPMRHWPLWAILIVGFVVRDFVQWWTHRLLHRSPFLWRFHKLHHSVEEMGFAAHLRYHWMETIVYRSIEYIPLALLGIGLHDFFLIHIMTLSIGHFNHSNITVRPQITGMLLGTFLGVLIAWGAFDIQLLPAEASLVSRFLVIAGGAVFGYFVLARVMRRLFNSPEMHIWHHSHALPEEHPYGVNFGISLALWDYIFGTAYVPRSGRDIKLGFPDMEDYPSTFWGQITYGFGNKARKSRS